MLVSRPEVCSGFAFVVEFVGDLSGYTFRFTIVLCALRYNEKFVVLVAKIIGRPFSLVHFNANRQSDVQYHSVVQIFY